MAYNPVNWEDSPSHNTALEAYNLNKMDAGIAANDTAISGFQTSINSITQDNTNIKTDITNIKAQLGGYSIKVCTRAEYDAMAVHPATTIYFFKG